jgi:hypothetical protein
MLQNKPASMQCEDLGEIETLGQARIRRGVLGE